MWTQDIFQTSTTRKRIQIIEKLLILLEGSLDDPFLKTGTVIADFQILGTLEDDIDIILLLLSLLLLLLLFFVN